VSIRLLGRSLVGCLVLGLFAGCRVSPPPRANALAVGGGVLRAGEGVRSPQWIGGTTDWFNGINLTNRSAHSVVIEDVTIRELGPDLRLVGVVFARFGELPRSLAGSFTGLCGTKPPSQYHPHPLTGFVIQSGESVLPIIGIADPNMKTESASGLRVKYRLEGHVLVQDFYYRAEFSSRRERCPSA
jgi:hypothetical protein